MPKHQEDRKNFIWQLQKQYGHYVSENGFLSCKGERINIKDENY